MGIKKINSQLTTTINVDILTIPVANLKSIIQSNESRMEFRYLWLTPLSIFITCLTVVLTASFKDVGLKSSVWEAIFWILTILSGIITLILLIYFFKNLSKGTVDSIMNEIKESSMEGELES